MFEQNQIKAWRSVTAPADLRERVMAAAGVQTAPKKAAMTPRRYAALAACAAIVLFAALTGYTQSAFNVENFEPTGIYGVMSAAARAVDEPTVKEFSLNAKHKTTVTVSGGTVELYSEEGELLSTGSSVTAKGNVLLRWSVSDRETDHTLRLESGLKSKTVTLAYDPASESWTTNIK